ncbi:hypothetical protein DC498_19215 [Terrimonas sp.]|uniref:PKD domain-containing protein n=1 Tax=Terrimonas sp. TaxID=1914338 RepID=UPI000D515BE4|nr:PKD domain-containing protein [Terrimonas sp.]PVD50557.1 hypothetical protein DC498_19215 [Terrimonas sp.]
MKLKFFILIAFLSIVFTTQGQFRKIYLDSDSKNDIVGIHLLSAKEGFVAFKKWIGYTQDSGYTFNKRYLDQVNIDGSFINVSSVFDINGVYAIDKNRIFVFGSFGFEPSLLLSTNGGISYDFVYHAQVIVNVENDGVQKIDFPTKSSVGYAIDNIRVLKTSNNGQSWSIVYEDRNAVFNDISFISDLVGYVTGEKGLVKTEDGGNSWQVINVPEGRISGMSFISENTGWLNISGRIYITKDGGNSWKLPNGGLSTIGSPIRFINDSVGYGVGSSFNTYKTTDGGKFWEPLPRDNNFSYDEFSHGAFFFLNASLIWVGGAHGFLELSINGGGTTLPEANFTHDLSGLGESNKVILTNQSKPGYEYSWFKNSTLISNEYDASYITDRYSIDTIFLIVKKGNISDTSDKQLIDTRANTQPCSANFHTDVDTGSVKLFAGYNAGGVKHYWDFGDGFIDSVNVSPEHLYKRVGTYTIKHKVLNTIDKCVDSTELKIIIERTQNCLSLDFSYEADFFYSNMLTFSFSFDQTKESNKESVELQACDWGDGSTTFGYTHTYDSAKIYNACFTIRNRRTGCVSQICKPVQISFPKACDADFILNDWTNGNVSFEGKPNVNSSDKRHTWIVNDRDIYTTKSATTFNKNFYIYDYGVFTSLGGGCWDYYYVNTDSIKNTVKHIVYDIKTNCSDTVIKQFTLKRIDDVVMNVKQDSLFPWSYIFTAKSVKNDSTLQPYVSYMWQWGKGSDPMRFTGRVGAAKTELGYIFPGPGKYFVAFASQRCQVNTGQIFYKIIDVPPMDCPIYPLSFTYSVPDPMVPNKVYFADETFLINPGLGNSGIWYFGDGDSSTNTHLTHEYKNPGTYKVTLRYKNQNGCTKETIKEITVNPPCNLKAKFSFSRDIVIPARISFSDNTEHGNESISYNWVFGTGDTSTLQNPVYLYTTPGIYKVILRVTDQQSCTNSYDTTIVITETDICNISVAFSYSIESSNVQFVNLTEPNNNGYIYQWNFGDSITNQQKDPLHVYLVNGKYDACLIVRRDSLCEGTFCDSISVLAVRRESIRLYPNPAASSVIAEFYSDESKPVTISIYNSFGTELFKMQTNCEIGLNREVINIISFPKGSYLLRVSGLDTKISKRFVKH